MITPQKNDRKFAYIPDLPDCRDFKYSAVAKAVKIPKSIDLRNKCSLVEDQGQLGSCVGNASVGALEYLINKNKANFIDLSRLFVYYNTRMIEGTVKFDCGCYIRDAIKILANYGVCSEKDWPYIISKFANKPTSICYNNALPNRISSYYRINTFDEMINCLAERYPIIMGFSVYEYFLSEEMSKKGILKMPTSKEKLLGGHAVLIVGYNQTTKRFLVRNSWGSNWALKGYFWAPFEYFTNPDLAEDFWTIRQ